MIYILYGVEFVVMNKVSSESMSGPYHFHPSSHLAGIRPQWEENIYFCKHLHVNFT